MQNNVNRLGRTCGNSQSRTIYDINGLSPTLNAGMSHGNTVPFIIEQQIVAMRGRDKTNPSYRGLANDNFEQRLEANQEGISNCITTVQKDNLVLETIRADCLRMVRTEEGKRLRKAYENHEISHGFSEHKTAEIRPDGLCNTITTVQKDNYIMEIGTTHYPHGWLDYNADFSGVCPTIDSGIWKHHTLAIEKAKIMDTVQIRQATKDGTISCKIGGVADLNYPTSKTRRGRVIDEGNVSPTLTTTSIPNVLEDWMWEIDGVVYLIRIRKLTPRECWRLMGFLDSDFNAASQVNSNTQLYKQAGNSIVVDVLENIFKQLL